MAQIFSVSKRPIVFIKTVICFIQLFPSPMFSNLTGSKFEP